MSKHTSKHLQHNLPFIMFVLSHRNSQQIKRLRLHKLEMILECLKKKKRVNRSYWVQRVSFVKLILLPFLTYLPLYFLQTQYLFKKSAIKCRLYICVLFFFIVLFLHRLYNTVMMYKPF